MDLIDRLYRIAGALLSGLTGPAFWTISSSGRVVGSLTYEAGTWCLAWFENADPALRQYRGAVTGEMEALAEALSARAGVPVSIDPVIF